MATTFPTLLNTLGQALLSALDSTNKLEAPTPVEDGISLLDVKNELFLSYLQNLVFLIILKLRNRSSGSDDESDKELDNSVVKKLVELQVYLEKGVRPLEARLKYQIDKVLRAADDAKRAEAAAAAASAAAAPKPKPQAQINASDSDSEAASDDEEGSDAGIALNAAEINDLQYRPNPSAFARPADAEPSYKNRGNDNSGVYKPPRIQATSMPTTTGAKSKESRKAQKSATMEEFVNTELSMAPSAEPSIGTTTVSGGRRTKSDKERQEEAERRDYEERNYVRLPKESKKDKKKKGNREKEGGYGGEEWRGIGEGVDRIERLTKRKDTGGVLEQSRKRKETVDGPRGSGGVEVGQGFQKRLKTLDGKRRDRGRN